MNILLDQESAEVVHIDLGVAFEQGKMLKMPERVHDYTLSRVFLFRAVFLAALTAFRVWIG